MKTIKKKKAMPAGRQEKSEIQQLRDIRDNIGLDIQNMTFEQLKTYIEERLTLHPTSSWRNGR